MLSNLLMEGNEINGYYLSCCEADNIYSTQFKLLICIQMNTYHKIVFTLNSVKHTLSTMQMDPLEWNSIRDSCVLRSAWSAKMRRKANKSLFASLFLTYLFKIFLPSLVSGSLKNQQGRKEGGWHAAMGPKLEWTLHRHMLCTTNWFFICFICI